MIDDDVHVDFQSARVRGSDERCHIGIRAEMGIDVREISDPIAMITGALDAGRSLHRLVLENGTQPDCRRAKPLDVIEPRD